MSQANKPVIAGREPAVLDLEPGTHYWCRCGRSARQPFCDGAHQGTDFLPLAFEIAQKRKVALCLCKQTSTPPHCDGSHRKLTD